MGFTPEQEARLYSLDKGDDLNTDGIIEVATEIGELVQEKNAAYGSAFAKAGDFLRILYPDGISPEQYNDMLLLVRIFDKQMRIANRKDAFGESPYRDIAGYGILGVWDGGGVSFEQSMQKAQRQSCTDL